MIGYVYRMTCLLPGEYYTYVGKRCSEKFDIRYFGSGSIWRRILNKYDLRAIWTKCSDKLYATADKLLCCEILAKCDTNEQLNHTEANLVEKEKKENDKCVNIAAGGTGGCSYKYMTEEQVRKAIENHKVSCSNRTEDENRAIRRKISEGWRRKSKEEKTNKINNFKKTWYNKPENERKALFKRQQITRDSKTEEEKRRINEQQALTKRNKSAAVKHEIYLKGLHTLKKKLNLKDIKIVYDNGEEEIYETFREASRAVIKKLKLNNKTMSLRNDTVGHHFAKYGFTLQYT